MDAIKKQRTCRDCDELFEPVGRELLCPECHEDREREREEARDARRKRG